MSKGLSVLLTLMKFRQRWILIKAKSKHDRFTAKIAHTSVMRFLPSPRPSRFLFLPWETPVGTRRDSVS